MSVSVLHLLMLIRYWSVTAVLMSCINTAEKSELLHYVLRWHVCWYHHIMISFNQKNLFSLSRLFLSWLHCARDSCWWVGHCNMCWDDVMTTACVGMMWWLHHLLQSHGYCIICWNGVGDCGMCWDDVCNCAITPQSGSGLGSESKICDNLLTTKKKGNALIAKHSDQRTS